VTYSIRWARGERGYCGKCGHQYTLIKSGVLRKHTRLIGDARFICEGSHENDVSMRVASRIMSGEPESADAVDPVVGNHPNGPRA